MPIIAYYERDACHLVRIIASAVDYLHDQGIVHRGKHNNQQFQSSIIYPSLISFNTFSLVPLG